MARALVLILLVWVWPASAADAELKYYANASWMGNGFPFSSAAAACAGTYAAASSSDKTLYSGGVTQVTETACYWSRSSGVQYVMSGLSKGYYCGSVPSAAGACPLTDDEKCGQKGSIGSSSTKWSYSGGYPGFGGGYCIGGCSYDLYGYESYDKSSNMSAATGVMKPVPGGKACSSSAIPKTDDTSVNGTNPTTAPTSSDPTPSACQTGQVPYKGIVNGKSVTVCGQATKSSSTGTTTTDSSGSTTTNTNGTQSTSSSSGTSNKTTRTTCENGQCTTTSSSTGSTGGGSGTSGGTSSSGSETKTQPQNEYCKDNPTAQVCKESDNSSFGGSCGAFTCDGDAIQCAIAREQHQRNCEVFEDTKSLSQVGVGQKGTDGTGSGDFVNSEESSLFSLASYIQQFENTVNLPATCISDQVIPFAGSSLVLPFSEYCEVIRAVGYAGNGITMILALNIVFGARRK